MPGVGSITRTFAVVAAAAIAAGAGWWLGTTTANAPGWGCPVERLGAAVIDGDRGGGAPTRLDALTAWIPSLVDDGTIPAERLEEAFASSSGPTRYDRRSGELRVDGNLVIVMTAGRNPDGTWTVGHIEQCMRPPAT